MLLQEDREKALRKRALQNTESLQHGTRALHPLEVHDTVQVQNQRGNKPSRWDITGTVVEIKDHDQYVVRVHGSGRVTLRNRKFLKKITPYCPSTRPNPPVMVQPSPQPQTQLPTTDTDQSLLQQPEQPPVLEETPEPRIPEPQP